MRRTVLQHFLVLPEGLVRDFVPHLCEQETLVDAFVGEFVMERPRYPTVCLLTLPQLRRPHLLHLSLLFVCNQWDLTRLKRVVWVLVVACE